MSRTRGGMGRLCWSLPPPSSSSRIHGDDDHMIVVPLLLALLLPPLLPSSLHVHPSPHYPPCCRFRMVSVTWRGVGFEGDVAGSWASSGGALTIGEASSQRFYLKIVGSRYVGGRKPEIWNIPKLGGVGQSGLP